MSVLIFLDHADGHIRKASLEAACYGAKVAEQTATTAEGIVLGNTSADLSALGQYGIKKVHTVTDASLNSLDAQVYAKVIADAASATGATVIVFSNNIVGKAVAPRVSARLKAGLVTGAVALPDTSNARPPARAGTDGDDPVGRGFVVKKNVFSGKAFANVAINTAVKIIAVNPNAYAVATSEGIAEVVPFNVTIEASKIQVSASSKVEGEVPLTEAEIVVSGGRGLKGPRKLGIGY